MTLIQTEPKAIKIGKPTTSSTQGPCDSGFHIPTKDEWEAVYDTMESIGIAVGVDMTSAANFTGYLKLPQAGQRSYYDGSVTSGSGYYWASTMSEYANILRISSNASYQYSQFSFAGNSIRPFKDVSVIPDNSWTSLFGTYIYHNSTLGLISLSSDGINWITIADKNLGATTVWNSGNTLTDANCGNFYQRGNNYGFPHSGNVTTSSTQVDASSYGPGNYYSSSTFIIRNNNTTWDSSDNKNLRGGVDTPISKVYLGSTQVRPKPTPITTPGIYHNSNLGLISLSSDGSTWLTIADKNLGATSTDISSTDSYGYVYQRGNNYGFPSTGSITTTSIQVNAGSYGPGNYYSSSTFSSNPSWDNSLNQNLRGGVTGTNEAMRGPCTNGYHIPTFAELSNMVSVANNLGITTYTDLMQYAKLPEVSLRGYNGDLYPTLSGYRSTSSTLLNGVVYGYSLRLSTLNQNGRNISDALPIRPFKDEAVQPDSSRTKLY